MTVWPAVLMLAILGAALTGCGVLDVWRHIWQTPEISAPVHRGESPTPRPLFPR